MSVLRKAWHLARADSTKDFLEDPYGYADFAANLDNELLSIAKRLKARESWPHAPIRRIDVPKSNLAVRPGAQMAMPDRIVLNAILILLAPELARKLTNGVFSCRPRRRRPDTDPSRIAHLLAFPFLKGTTVRRYLHDSEPWYAAWPEFMAEARRLARDNYHFMVVTDISAYFENIDIHLLREILCERVSPKHRPLVALLCDMLAKWEWPAAYKTCTSRGIPQGDDTCRLIGNAYLMHLDERFAESQDVKSGDVKYLRYMDDVKLLTRTRESAIRSLQLMNHLLRDLRLNIQGSKTRLLTTAEEITEELTDPRLDCVNAIVTELQAMGNRVLSKKARRAIGVRLNKEAKSIKGWLTPAKAKAIKKGQHVATLTDSRKMRLYARILTARILIQDNSETALLLHQIYHNPDARLLDRALRYFENVPDIEAMVSAKVLTWLSNPLGESLLFAYTKGKLLRLLRHLPPLPQSAFKIADRLLADPAQDPYVQQQAAQLLSLMQSTPKRRHRYEQMFHEKQRTEVRQALLGLWLSPEIDTLKQQLRATEKANRDGLRRTARYLYRLATEKPFALDFLRTCRRRPGKAWLADHQVELRVIKAANFYPNAIKRDPASRCLVLRDKE